MRAALLFAAVCVTLCALPARAADEPYRRSGFEVGGAYLAGGGGSSLDPRWSAYTVSLGRWQRLTRSVTWVNRLQYAGLPHVDFGNSTILDGHLWYDVGHSVSIETGLELHPPVIVGLAPYLGLNAGLGVARWGDEHSTAFDYTGPRSVTTITHRGTALALLGGVEIGIRVFAERPWPNLCLTLGGHFLDGPHGDGFAAEPFLSLGY